MHSEIRQMYYYWNETGSTDNPRKKITSLLEVFFILHT